MSGRAPPGELAAARILSSKSLMAGDRYLTLTECDVSPSSAWGENTMMRLSPARRWRYWRQRCA